MTAVRIYVVTTPTGIRLIRAANKIQALGYVARDTLTAEVATQDDLYTLAKNGTEVEDAKASE